MALSLPKIGKTKREESRFKKKKWKLCIIFTRARTKNLETIANNQNVTERMFSYNKPFNWQFANSFVSCVYR